MGVRVRKSPGFVPRPVLEDAYCDQIEIGARAVQGGAGLTIGSHNYNASKSISANESDLRYLGFTNCTVKRRGSGQREH